ncbi:MAG: hypothetical protein ACI3XI_02070 [Eubacteriales bacterium]
MIYFISDLHGEPSEAFCEYVENARQEDTLIILGDIGLAFWNTDENREFTEWFRSLSCNIAFIDGNHENFDYLYSFPEEDWHGGRVHRISPTAVHLMRGYVFEIEGMTFFTMGGCLSSHKWFERGWRWEAEEPSEGEIARGYDSLVACGNKVDYVLTHKYRIEDENAARLSFDGLINFIEREVSFTHWYSGHWHKYKRLDERHTVIGKQVFPLE